MQKQKYKILTNKKVKCKKINSKCARSIIKKFK